MATVTRTVCDLHLRRGEEVDASTRSIVVDGKNASVDLCDACYQEHIQPVIDLIEQLRNPTPAEKAPVETPVEAPVTTAVETAVETAVKTAAKKPSRQRGSSPAAIRKWAQEQGIEVSASGRVPREVRDRYLAAH
jgi:pyruvate/2-oxoglutarate dehydrogenase complex dihydrolipoamide acyltransferase (E2) component